MDSGIFTLSGFPHAGHQTIATSILAVWLLGGAQQMATGQSKSFKGDSVTVEPRQMARQGAQIYLFSKIVCEIVLLLALVGRIGFSCC